MRVPPAVRILLVLPAVAALILGVLSGLARLGVPMPDIAIRLIPVHGALMIGAFFGALIGLERAVALSRPWPYLAPLMADVAGLALIFNAPVAWAALAMSASSVVMTSVCAQLWLRQRVAHHAALAIAAAVWLAGNLVWLTQGTFAMAVPLWASFLILTIAAERLELSRFLPTPRFGRVAFQIIVAALCVAAAASVFDDRVAPRAFAAALGMLAIWLLRYDIARRTVRNKGLTRYMAVGLLSGYAWLGLGALLGAAGGFEAGSPLRDATLHATLLGFVFSMVFAHAPVIIPALAGVRFNWHKVFYAPLALLHLSLLLRIASVPLESFALRQYGAQLNALVLLVFIAMSLLALRRIAKRGWSVTN